MAEAGPLARALGRLGWAWQGRSTEPIDRAELMAALQARLPAGGIDPIVRELTALHPADGLVPANEWFYRLLLHGMPVNEFTPEGRSQAASVALIDWHDPAANRWSLGETQAGALVGRVNGLPLLLIEAGPGVPAAIGRHLQQQRPDAWVPWYAYAQLLVALGDAEAAYGCTGNAVTWSAWPGGVEPLVPALLQPARLLAFLHAFVLFDRRAGKLVARPAQVEAVQAVVRHLGTPRPDGTRPGGTVLHAAGAGKRVMLAFLAGTLLRQRQFQACRVVVVSDRPDQQQRLARHLDTAMNPPGRDLAWRLAQGPERVIVTSGARFAAALRRPACRNESADLIVLIDQDGDDALTTLLHRTWPRAACIVVTGVPLPALPAPVHAYPAARAVADGARVPLYGEERRVGGTGADRIPAIARDIAAHFSNHVRPLGAGLQGQLIAASAQDARHYQQCLDATGRVSSALRLVPRRQPLPGGPDGDPDLLIVVDHLLQGSQVPRLAVLYLDRALPPAVLSQALASVARPCAAKTHAVLIDYGGHLPHPARHGGDATGPEWQPFRTDYQRLPALHRAVWERFNTAGLDEATHRALAQFNACLQRALSCHGFFADPDVVPEQVRAYQRDLRFFAELPRAATAREPAADYRAAAPAWLDWCRRVLAEAGAGDAALLADEAGAIEQAVRRAVDEHGLHVHDMAAAIRAALLPRWFALLGLEGAKAVVEQVIQVVASPDGIARFPGRFPADRPPLRRGLLPR